MKPTAKNIQRLRKALLEHELQLAITVNGYAALFNGNVIFAGLNLQEIADKLNLYNIGGL
ncbi:HTH-type transcriptional regulator [Anabaena phage Elbi]|nr:HTH-type transcriptional regulator [Anabaena phage Elbi]